MTAYQAQDPHDRMVWRDQGRCRGLDTALFFPGRGDSAADAQQVCAGCPVARKCLVHALAIPEKFGIWAGTSERERRRIRRRLGLSKRSAAA